MMWGSPGEPPHPDTAVTIVLSLRHMGPPVSLLDRHMVRSICQLAACVTPGQATVQLLRTAWDELRASGAPPIRQKYAWALRRIGCVIKNALADDADVMAAVAVPMVRRVMSNYCNRSLVVCNVPKQQQLAVDVRVADLLFGSHSIGLPAGRSGQRRVDRAMDMFLSLTQGLRTSR